MPVPEPSGPLLDVTGLTATFDTAAGRLSAVDEVDLHLDRGETLGLVGESGCGKSVTALAIMGMVPPPGRVVSGSIRLAGRELLGLEERELRRIRGAEISLVFQEPASALNPVFTIGAQVAEALLVHGRASRSDARREAIDLLAAVRLPDPHRRARDYPHQLSGGMRQRVLIAMALACRPSLLIADEPTTALDVTIQSQILDLLREMRQSYGLSLLLITHDFGVVAGMADRVAVMYAGRVVESGSVDRIFDRPQHPYTRGLLASMPDKARGRRLQAIDGTVPNLAALPPGCAFAPRCPDRHDRCLAAPPPQTVGARGETLRCYLPQTPGQGPVAERRGSDSKDVPR